VRPVRARLGLVKLKARVAGEDRTAPLVSDDEIQVTIDLRQSSAASRRGISPPEPQAAVSKGRPQLVMSGACERYFPSCGLYSHDETSCGRYSIHYLRQRWDSCVNVIAWKSAYRGNGRVASEALAS
jgi:hypothetical protein